MRKFISGRWPAVTASLLALLLCGCGCDYGYTENSARSGTTVISAESYASQTQKEEEKMTAEIKNETTAAGASADVYTPQNYDDFKAMWLSQFDMADIYVSGGTQRSEASFTSYVKKIMANIKSVCVNTVIVQVRPYADSMYPSDYYPMSSIAVGSYGNTASYDPFAIIIKEAHAIGLSVQAWINPMRAMLDSEIGSVSDKYPIKQWYSDKSLN